MEYVGKVAMDYSMYPGEDYYSDGEIEEELLAIARDLSPIEFELEIEKRKSWPILYHLSAKRENIVDWIPFTKDQKVLEVGSGCGAITGALSRKSGSVTCVDLSKKRSLINAYRHSECDNVTIHLGNFKDVEPTLDTDYDYVLLIGVFEYGQGYIGGETPFVDFLNLLKNHVKPDGRIVIAIENKYGLKYFAGCREDHLGTFFSGIENYPEGGGVRTFSRTGLEKIFEACDISNYQFYYPYPDYKFMTHIYSDSYLPKQGELFNNYRNFDRDRMLLFDETKAFNSILQDDLFPVFSNSYLVVLGENLPVQYAKYSNDRASEFAISTKILTKEDGTVVARKYPLTDTAREHILGMADAYESLRARYEGSELAINTCTLVDAEECYAEFEYVAGIPLSEYFDQYLAKDDIEGFMALYKEYLKRIEYNNGVEVSDFDLIFSNILVGEDGTWTIIDYEWTFGEIIDAKKLAYRGIYCYLLEDEKRNNLPWDEVMEFLALTEKEEDELREREINFQKYVNGERASMVDMRNLIGNKIYQPTKWFSRMGDTEEMNRVQIYENCGNGFSEEASYFVPDAYHTDTEVEFITHIPQKVEKLRLDPCMASCVVKITEMTLNGKRLPLNSPFFMLSNGRICNRKKQKDGTIQPTIVFGKADPQIHLNLKKQQLLNDNILYVKMEVTRLPEAMASDLQKATKFKL